MNMSFLKIKNQPDLEVIYKIVDADRVHASHLPENGFQKNPAYIFENERLYHREASRREGVIEYAAKLDPAFLLDCPSAVDGAPIVTKTGIVLGGNCRTMAIKLAYSRSMPSAVKYRETILNYARENGVEIEDCDHPVLIRELAHEIAPKEAQALISALNVPFTASKTARADARSRAMRFSPRTLRAISNALADRDTTLRGYFDTPESLAIVNMLVNDGIIMDTEKNQYLDGNAEYLNPEGKTLVEAALRSTIFQSYEALLKMPQPLLDKLDAAIPSIMIASSIQNWDIRGIIEKAIDLYFEYKINAENVIDIFLNRMDMLKGSAPVDRFSKLEVAIFKALCEAKKKDFVHMFGGYAGAAKGSSENGGFGLISREQAIKNAFGVEIEAITNNQAQKDQTMETKPKNTAENQAVKQEIEKEAHNQDMAAPQSEPKTRKPRAHKNDCDKQNSTLVCAVTCDDLETITAMAAERLGFDDLELIPNSKTQFRIADGAGNELPGYRIIRSGKQWQLRRMNEAGSINSAPITQEATTPETAPESVISADFENSDATIGNEIDGAEKANAAPEEEQKSAYELRQQKRREYYTQKAEQCANNASRLYDHAREMASVIPLGQPILIGHHSEKTDRNYRNRIHNTYGKAFNEYDKAKYYEDKAASVGRSGISSDDSKAIEKLNKKLTSCIENHEHMKHINKLVKREWGAEKNIEILVDDGMDRMEARILINNMYQYSFINKPYNLTPSNNEIKRLRERIAVLKKAQAQESKEIDNGDYTYREDTELNRVMFMFNGKPSTAIRDILKSSGFRWAPSNCAWQRMLNPSGKYAAQRVIEKLDAIFNANKKGKRDLTKYLASNYTYCNEYLELPKNDIDDKNRPTIQNDIDIIRNSWIASQQKKSIYFVGDYSGWIEKIICLYDSAMKCDRNTLIYSQYIEKINNGEIKGKWGTGSETKGKLVELLNTYERRLEDAKNKRYRKTERIEANKKNIKCHEFLIKRYKEAIASNGMLYAGNIVSYIKYLENKIMEKQNFPDTRYIYEKRGHVIQFQADTPKTAPKTPYKAQSHPDDMEAPASRESAPERQLQAILANSEMPMADGASTMPDRDTAAQYTPRKTVLPRRPQGRIGVPIDLAWRNLISTYRDYERRAILEAAISLFQRLNPAPYITIWRPVATIPRHYDKPPIAHGDRIIRGADTTQRMIRNARPPPCVSWRPHIGRNVQIEPVAVVQDRSKKGASRNGGGRLPTPVISRAINPVAVCPHKRGTIKNYIKYPGGGEGKKTIENIWPEGRARQLKWKYGGKRGGRGNYSASAGKRQCKNKTSPERLQHGSAKKASGNRMRVALRQAGKKRLRWKVTSRMQPRGTSTANINFNTSPRISPC